MTTLIVKNMNGYLSSLGYQIFTKMVSNRIELLWRGFGRKTAVFLPECFKGGSPLHCIRQLSEKYWEYNKDTWHCFIDFKLAYDNIHSDSLWITMES